MGDAWTDPVSNPLLAAIMSWRSQKCQASADVARKSLARRAEHEHNVLAVRQDVLSHRPRHPGRSLRTRPFVGNV